MSSLMSSGRALRGLLLALLVIVTCSCANDLTKNLDGKSCNGNHECSDGYRCDEASLICVRGPSEGAPVNCQDGTVECNGKCARLDTDPKNCGGCGATCSAPAHG